jgi:hypothetical protein
MGAAKATTFVLDEIVFALPVKSSRKTLKDMKTDTE